MIELVPNAVNHANQGEVLSFLILANRWKFFVLDILSVLRLDRGGTLNQRVKGLDNSMGRAYILCHAGVG